MARGVTPTVDKDLGERANHMQYSEYTKRYQTNSFYINTIRAAVEEYEVKHGGHGDIRVQPTHISADDYTAQGHAESLLDGVIIEVERIALRRVEESVERVARLDALFTRLDKGELTYDEYVAEYCLSF